MKNFYKNKKVVVTGAGGFIGSAMVRLLVARGANVTACVSLKNHDNPKMQGATYVAADLMEYKICKKLLFNQDMVLHFAGLDGGFAFKRTHNEEIFRTNTQMARNILRAAYENKLKRILIISSIEVYAEDAPSPISEDMGFVGEAKKDIWGYAFGKRQIEREAMKYFREYTLPVAIARLGNIYGPGDSVSKKRAIPTFIQNIRSGQPITLFNKRMKAAFLSVHDLVRTLLDLTELYAVGDPVNIVSEQEVSLVALVKEISKLVDRKPIIRYKNGMKGKARQSISTAKAKKVLHYHEEISLKQGLKELIFYPSH